ncbi:hypothetical protein EPI10_022826 [Gossypium australe]|uniref:Uncharacterized protein n=1 Tax=Gossypium australe TaxID=47621 RepID=A0A5B6VSF1_9ROSI|nr:hypothetical protein EPI10_022826 [Gossypium australe]
MATPKKKDREVNNVSTYNKGYSKAITVSQPKVVIAGQQGPELYQRLFDTHVVSPFYLKPLQPPYPKWYDPNAQCDYYTGITGHSIENCTTFKKLVERFIKMGIVKSDDLSKPDHFDEVVNAIMEGGDKQVVTHRRNQK